MIPRVGSAPLIAPIDTWECGAYRCELRQQNGIRVLTISGGVLAQPYHAVIRFDARTEAWRLVQQLNAGLVPKEGTYRKMEIPMVMSEGTPIRRNMRLVVSRLGLAMLAAPDLLPPPVPNRADHPFVGKLLVHGMPILVENVKGSLRSGVDADGKPWSVRMGAHYGEIEGTQSTDGDAVDVYVGEDLDAECVYVVHQKKPGTNEYDEPKCLIGFSSAGEAERFYRSQYNRPGFFGGMDGMPVAQFWAAVASGAFRKLAGDGAMDRAHQRQTLGLSVRKSVPRSWILGGPSPSVQSPAPGGGRSPRLVVRR